MSAHTAAEKAAQRIFKDSYVAHPHLRAYINEWAGSFSGVIQAAIDAETKPLVDALRGAAAFIRCAKYELPSGKHDPHVPGQDDANDELARLNTALAPFKEREGGAR